MGRTLDTHILAHLRQYIPNNSRQQIIKDIKRIAQETRVDILFFMDGSLKSKPIDEEVFAPLLPHLSLVSGIGCGFDHSTLLLLPSLPHVPRHQNKKSLFPLPPRFPCLRVMC